jgi:thioredoxin 1
MAIKNDAEAEITEEEFKEIINNGHKLVIVDFFAEWCMPCLMLAPIIDELSESDSMKEVKFVKINIDENQRLAQKYNISSIPCLIIFQKGREVDRIIGAQSGESIEDKIESHL